MRRLLKLLFSFEGAIDRRAYVLVALLGVIVKYGLDITIAARFSRPWDFAKYLMPLGIPVPIGELTRPEIQFLAAMLGASVPFAWVGLAVTTKRFFTIGWPSWLVVLFFVPIANIASFALAAAWPEEAAPALPPARSWLERIVPSDWLGAALLAAVGTAVVGTALVPVATIVLGSYGWGLFAGLPFMQGAVAAFVYAVRGVHSLRGCVAVAMLSIVVTAAALLGLAWEGAACILMAAPIALAFAALGACVGYTIAKRTFRVNAAIILVCVTFAPALMGVEAFSGRIAPTYEVTTSLEIDAPPDVVWRNVVSFPDIPAPTELPFELGIAYPIRAKIVGRGVGAVRYCEFSTGDFVEPITVWVPGRKLAFAVRRSAEPMREWSPYGKLDTPHLHGYMQSRRGQFVLTPLPGGRTRLTGTTWYQHHLWPAAYWALWSDAIVHDIHYRVLNHIKNVSESKPPLAAPRT